MMSAKTFNSFSLFVLFQFQLTPLLATAVSEEDARRELQTRNIPFNANVFVQRTAQGDLPAVELFLAAGMKPNVRNREGRNALLVAAREGHLGIVKTLLAKGADVNGESRNEDLERGKTALMFAAQRGHAGIVQALLDRGADVNARTDASKEFDLPGWTPLIWAASEGHMAVVKLLLANSADLHTKDNKGRTALWHAANNGYSDIVQLFKKIRTKN